MANKIKKLGIVVVNLTLLFTVVHATVHPSLPLQADASEFETRCGWLVNPTPGNMWLFDRDAQWVIGTQGGYQMEGDWDIPNFNRRQWIQTNVGSYGYGCACLRARVNKKTREVIE